jgi:hypothetical protein
VECQQLVDPVLNMSYATMTTKQNVNDRKLWSVYINDKENINPQTGELAARSGTNLSLKGTKTAFSSPARKPLQEIDGKTLLPRNIMASASTSLSANPKTDKSATKKVFYR